MVELHAFLDRDVFLKLICCDIWDESLAAIQITHPFRLASASAKGCEKPLKRRKLDDGLHLATIARLHRICSIVPVMPDTITQAAQAHTLFNPMIGTAGIDGGEAILALGVLQHEAPSRLITGDKRFLNALAEHFPTEYRQLRPLTVTFERCLLAVCDIVGFEAIRERLIVARKCDGTLDLALKSHGGRSANSFKEYLRGFDPLGNT